MNFAKESKIDAEFRETVFRNFFRETDKREKKAKTFAFFFNERKAKNFEIFSKTFFSRKDFPISLETLSGTHKTVVYEDDI